MKKLLFSLAFIAATLTSCLTDKPGLNYEGKDAVNYTIGINVPELATRAGETGMNSGMGAIDNFSDDEWAKYDLRYMLEVYDVSEGFENLDAPVKKRMVKTFDSYTETTFELRLIPNRTYKFVVWADFVLQDSEEDLNYDTSSLADITRKDNATVIAMDECMDAYFIQEDIEVRTTHSSTLTLTRPFGKIRVIATDVDEVNIGSTPASVDVTFYNYPTFVSLNALSGETESTIETVTYSYVIAKDAPYTQGYDAEAKNQTLFADYIFAQPQTDGAQETNFFMTIWGEDGRVIREHDFNTQIPLKRNHLTTIMGNLLTTATEFNVSIDDNFNGWYDINYNPDAQTLATPVVNADVVENVVTLSWDAVENADYYTVAYNGVTFDTIETMEVIENLEYDTDYVFEVSAHSNDTFNYNASEPAAVYVRIENIATCIEFTYAEVSPNYNAGWTDFNIDFYNENASCLASFNLWNICQSNFIPEGEYFIKTESPCIYPENFSYITLNGTTYNFETNVGSVTVSEVNGLYEITMDNIRLINGPEFNGKFTGTINGMIVPSEANNGGENEENTVYKVYATTDLGWEYMDIWIWNDTGNLTTNPYWPGDAMGKEVVDGVEYFVYTLPENVSMYSIVLSTDWGNVQTVDYTNIIADRDRFFRVITTTDNAGHYYIEEITFGGNEGGNEGEAITYEILNVTTGYDQQGEKELQFWYSATNAHVFDFKGFDACVPGQPVAAGYYSTENGGLDGTYCIFDYGTTNGSMSYAECTVTDNGSGSYTYDAKFVHSGQEYAFVYTSPAEQVEESVNTVELVSKSAGEVIGSYYYGWTLADAEGNNSVKLVIDQAALDQATDFPKAHEYTAFQSSPSYIMNGSHFSFVNNTLKVNGKNYKNNEVSNAKLTVVEATSITVEFTVDGKNYKFVYNAF